MGQRFLRSVLPVQSEVAAGTEYSLLTNCSWFVWQNMWRGIKAGFVSFPAVNWRRLYMGGPSIHHSASDIYHLSRHVTRHHQQHLWCGNSEFSEPDSRSPPSPGQLWCWRNAATPADTSCWKAGVVVSPDRPRELFSNDTQHIPSGIYSLTDYIRRPLRGSDV